MEAGPGIAPGTRAYETLEILLLHPAIDKTLAGPTLRIPFNPGCLRAVSWNHDLAVSRGNDPLLRQ